jgi:hypothetical protein
LAALKELDRREEVKNDVGSKPQREKIPAKITRDHNISSASKESKELQRYLRREIS